MSDLRRREHSVLIETEYSISGDGVIGQKPAAYYLVEIGKITNTLV